MWGVPGLLEHLKNLVEIKTQCNWWTSLDISGMLTLCHVHFSSSSLWGSQPSSHFQSTKLKLYLIALSVQPCHFPNEGELQHMKGVDTIPQTHPGTTSPSGAIPPRGHSVICPLSAPLSALHMMPGLPEAKQHCLTRDTCWKLYEHMKRKFSAHWGPLNSLPTKLHRKQSQDLGGGSEMPPEQGTDSQRRVRTVGTSLSRIHRHDDEGELVA